MIIENRLEELGIELRPLSAPVANYLHAKQFGKFLYVSGCAPMKDAISSLASSMALRASRPKEWMEDALPQMPLRYGIMASSASVQSGAEAAQSM